MAGDWPTPASGPSADGKRGFIAAWLPTLTPDELAQLDAAMLAILRGRLTPGDAEAETAPIDRIDVGLAELRNAAPEAACPLCATFTDAETGC